MYRILLALFALWQLAGSFAVAGTSGALARARWIWHLERAIHLPSEAVVQRATLAVHHRDPFDRILIARSIEEKLPLITADPIFERYPIDVIW